MGSRHSRFAGMAPTQKFSLCPSGLLGAGRLWIPCNTLMVRGCPWVSPRESVLINPNAPGKILQLAERVATCLVNLDLPGANPTVAKFNNRGRGTADPHNPISSLSNN
jgi:hypothetical protein